MVDPWLEGKVFDDSWDLISKTKFQYEDFNKINHIWFSHEHPDHFSPPNLKKIDSKFRKKINIYYQKTKDKKVKGFCEKLNFKSFTELKNLNEYEIENSYNIICGKYHNVDSWLCHKIDDSTILNLNDCIINSDKELTKLKNRIGNIDVLLTQFSYANWAGNTDEKFYRKNHAISIIKRLLNQIRVLKPKYIIPFASNIYFCHDENKYMNDFPNSLFDVEKKILAQNIAKPIILYPGDSWKISDPINNNLNIKKYNSDLNLKLNEVKNFTKQRIIFEEELFKESLNFTKKFKKGMPIFWKLLKKTYIYLQDYNQLYEFSISSGLIKCNKNKPFDVQLSSSSLMYALKFMWGGDTIEISGKVQKNLKTGKYKNYRTIFYLASKINNGYKINFLFLLKNLFKLLFIYLKK